MRERYRYSKTVILLFLMVLCFPLSSLISQESSGDTGNGISDSTENSNNSDNTEPPVDRRKEVLLYGIDDQVKTVLADLQKDKIAKYNELLKNVYEDTRNTDIREGIFRLWDDTSYKEGLSFARKELENVINDEDYNPSTVQAAIAFIADQEDTESLPLLYKLVSERNTRLAAASVRAIGKIPPDSVSDGDSSGKEAELLERLNNEDPIAEDDLVAALILTLGELGYKPAADELVEIVEDSGGSPGHRRLACISLGKIGRSEDFEIVERLYYESEDATLRSYALAGLAEFPDHDISQTLIQALKRDSFWKIRVTAAEKLSGMKAEGINELLQYKASNDPVPQVRIASLKALGASGEDEDENFTYLTDFFKNNKNGADLRLACLSVLVDNEIPGTIEAVNTVMDELWEKDEGRFLEFICRDLSLSNWKDLAPLYERMLTHSNWLLQIYGIRGIRRNDILSLEGKIENLDKDGVDSRVRREVNTGS